MIPGRSGEVIPSLVNADPVGVVDGVELGVKLLVGTGDGSFFEGCVAVAVLVGLFVAVLVGVLDGTVVLVGELVTVGVLDGTAVLVGTSVGVLDGIGVFVGTLVGVLEGIAVLVGTAVGTGVGGGVAVGTSVGGGAHGPRWSPSCPGCGELSSNK